MRKMFLSLLILSLLFTTAGCGNESPDDSVDDAATTVTDVNDATVITGDLNIFETDWCDIELDPAYPVDLESMNVLDEMKPINTLPEATAVGINIIANLHEEGHFSDLVLAAITHSTEDNVWRFGYSLDYRASVKAFLTVGEVLYVAIDGNNGSIIQAWLDG